VAESLHSPSERRGQTYIVSHATGVEDSEGIDRKIYDAGFTLWSPILARAIEIYDSRARRAVVVRGDCLNGFDVSCSKRFMARFRIDVMIAGG
jgi:hypothetical protein